ncbi:MAG: hypothetical protein WBH40_17345 [Ignavibacteriaceae bacterium]|jgi:hypothetical protein
MEKEEKTQKTNEEEKSQGGCCDFSSEETQGMFKMMRDFCGDPETDSSDCRSMMKEMMKNKNSKSEDSGCAGVKKNI